jgi:hypothetical protein
MMRGFACTLLAFSLMLSWVSCRKSEPVQTPSKEKDFQGAKLNRRYQLPNMKSFVTLPEDWKAQVKLRPDWKQVKPALISGDQKSVAEVPNSQLIFEARPTLEDWKPHLTRLEVFLDDSIPSDLTLNAYAQSSASSTGDATVQILHAEREQLTLDEREVLSLRRDLAFKSETQEPFKMRQYILHALIPIPELQNQKVGLTFVLSATGLDTLKDLKEKTLRAIMASLSFKKRS